MKLEETEKLCEEATEGPWETSHNQYYDGEVFGIDREYDYRDPHVNRLIVSTGSSEYGDQYGVKKAPDARFIAAARELMPKLLAVAKAAKRMSERFHGVDGIDEALRELEK